MVDEGVEDRQGPELVGPRGLQRALKNLPAGGGGDLVEEGAGGGGWVCRRKLPGNWRVGASMVNRPRFHYSRSWREPRSKKIAVVWKIL